MLRTTHRRFPRRSPTLTRSRARFLSRCRPRVIVISRRAYQNAQQLRLEGFCHPVHAVVVLSLVKSCKPLAKKNRRAAHYTWEDEHKPTSIIAPDLAWTRAKITFTDSASRHPAIPDPKHPMIRRSRILSSRQKKNRRSKRHEELLSPIPPQTAQVHLAHSALRLRRGLTEQGGGLIVEPT
jgi:hypothetical protein